MLKKLVKYGNSNALVLDKSLLELLNIAEGAVVKIKTDGTSLIITPQHTTKQTVMQMITPEEKLHDAVEELNAQQCKNPNLVPELAQEMKTSSQNYVKPSYHYIDKENKGKLEATMIDLKKVHEKYQHIHQQAAQLLESPDFIDASALVAEKYHATKNSPEYIQEYNALIASYIPEYAVYQYELKKISESLQ